MKSHLYELIKICSKIKTSINITKGIIAWNEIDKKLSVGFLVNTSPKAPIDNQYPTPALKYY